MYSWSFALFTLQAIAPSKLSLLIRKYVKQYLCREVK
jgi:hypothetical protein